MRKPIRRIEFHLPQLAKHTVFNRAILESMIEDFPGEFHVFDAVCAHLLDLAGPPATAACRDEAASHSNNMRCIAMRTESLFLYTGCRYRDIGEM